MKPQIYGLTASASMFLFYAIVVTYFNSFEHAVAQFLSIWPLMVSLIAGFGVQVGLFFYLREKAAGQSALAAASSGTVSAGSMVACCAHHISDVLLFSGLSFLAAFVNKYQAFFISAGIVSNILGSVFMLRTMQRHKIKFGKASTLGKIMRYDMDNLLKLSAFVGFAALSFVFIGSA